MVLFAGPIVIQWYWIPIFIVVTFVLPALTVGVISEFFLRARSGPRTWAKRGRMWGVVAVTLVLLSLVFDVALPKLQDRRARRGPPPARSTSRRTSRDRSPRSSPSRP